MTNCKRIFTASIIKYLLVMQDLEQVGEGIRCADVAKRLSVTRPSVHAMMRTLKEIQLVDKDRYGSIYFTELGRALSCKCKSYYNAIISF